MVLIHHRRTESDATDAAEWHQEPFHGPVGVGEVVGVSRGAVVQAADEAESGPRGEVGSGRGLQLALCPPLSHSHPQQLHLMTPSHPTHGRAMFQ